MPDRDREQRCATLGDERPSWSESLQVTLASYDQMQTYGQVQPQEEYQWPKQPPGMKREPLDLPWMGEDGQPGKEMEPE